MKISTVRKVRNVSIYTDMIDTNANNAKTVCIDVHQGVNSVNVCANAANPANPANPGHNTLTDLTKQILGTLKFYTTYHNYIN